MYLEDWCSLTSVGNFETKGIVETGDGQDLKLADSAISVGEIIEDSGLATLMSTPTGILKIKGEFIEA
jgi:hypothetical protein